MRDKILTIVSRVLNVPVGDLTDASSPDTIKNWDSLKHMALVLAIEEELRVTFSDEEIVKTVTVGGIIETVDKIASKSA